MKSKVHPTYKTVIQVFFGVADLLKSSVWPNSV